MFRFLSCCRRPFFLIFFFAFVLRGAVVFVNIDSFRDDPDQYSALAQNVRSAGVFGTGKIPTAFRPPLYPFLLRCAYVFTPASSPANDNESENPFLLSKESAAALLNWILGVLTVLIVYKFALILTFPVKWAAAAALLTAVDPILLAQSRLVMTETTAAFLGVLIIWLLTKAMCPRRKNLFFFFSIGFLAGLSGLCRPVFILFGALIFLGLLNYTRIRKIPLSVGVSFFAGLLAVLLPWAARNQAQVGVFTPATTHGGYTLLLANNKSIYAYNRSPGPFAGPWDPASFHQEWESIAADDAGQRDGLTEKDRELYRDELARDTAHDVMSNDLPGGMLAAVIRVGNLWQFLPYKTISDESQLHALCRYLVGIFYFLEIPLAFLGLCHICAPLVSQRRHRLLISPYWSNWSWPVFLLLSIQIPHILYWTNMRMRAPLMTIVPIFALIGVRYLIAKKDERPVVNGGLPTSDCTVISGKKTQQQSKE